MDDEFLDSGESEGLQITSKVKSLLIVVSRWCFITSIFGFSLVLAGVVIFFFMLNDFSRGYYGIREDEIVGLGLMILGMVTVFLISKFLLDYARNIKKCFLRNSDIHLEKAFKSLRNALAMIGVIWGIAAVLLLFVSVIALYFMNY